MGDINTELLSGNQGQTEQTQVEEQQQTQEQHQQQMQAQNIEQQAQNTQNTEQNEQDTQDIEYQDFNNLFEPLEETQKEIQQAANEQAQILQQIASEAAKLANDEYKRLYGEDFDQLTATPEQLATFNSLLMEYHQQLKNAYEEQVKQLEQQQIVEQRVAQVMQAAKQKFGEDTIEKIKNEIIPNLTVKEYWDLERRFDEVILKGDVNSALAIYEEILAKAKNQQGNDDIKIINPMSVSNANIQLQQKQPDINDELLNLAEI